MKKQIHLSILVASALMMSACTHIAVARFDKQANTVTIQGGKWASTEDYQKAAEKYCGGSATLLNMGQRTVGTYTTANVQSYGSSANGSATTVGIQRYDYTFSCDNH
jgi:hypothetical protein